MSAACDLAACAGPAAAAAAAAATGAEYGREALPMSLLRRVAACGVWAEFGDRIVFADGESGPLAAIRDFVAAGASGISSAVGSLLEPTSPTQASRGKAVGWSLPAFLETANASLRAKQRLPDIERGAATPPPPPPPSPLKQQLERGGGLSFAFAEADYFTRLMGDDAASTAFCRSFFVRVEALAAARAEGRRPLDALAAAEGPPDFPPVEPAGRVAGPWSRLGALKRRATLWGWNKGERATVGVERRKTVPH